MLSSERRLHEGRAGKSVNNSLRRNDAFDLSSVSLEKQRTLAGALIQPLSGLIPADFVKRMLPQKLQDWHSEIDIRSTVWRQDLHTPKIRLDIRWDLIEESRRF